MCSSLVMVIVPCDFNVRFSGDHPEEKWEDLKKSGRIVARSGRKDGREPVMMISAVSQIDQLK